MHSLSQQLEDKKKEYKQSWDASTLALHQNGIDQVEASEIINNAIQVGQKAPNFKLHNQLDKVIKLELILQKGPVVLTWYRGGWCPYCNLTHRALQQVLPEIKKLGASLLCLTPEVPDQSLSTIEKNQLDFEVLSDLHNRVGKTYGVVFRIEDNVAKVYQNGFNLHAYNGDNSNELPLAATYIIDKDRVVKWAFLNSDYRNRAEPQDILNELKKIL